MVKAPYTLQHLDRLAQKHYRYIFDQSNLMTELDKYIQGPAAPFVIYVRDNLETIIAGRPAVLESISGVLDGHIDTSRQNYQHLNPAATDGEINAWIKGVVLSIFNYDYDHDGFTKRYRGRLAYEHSRDLNISTCPYCNAQFTFTFDVNEGKSRPQFDHFLYKGRYPYFAISFYNLIPSCSVCNSSIKGTKLFSVNTHLHPFLEGMEGALKFETQIKSVDFLVQKKEFELHMVPRDGADDNHITRCERSLHDFAILDRYKFHRDYAGEIIRKAHLYTNKTLKTLIEGFDWEDNPIFNSPEQALENFMGNFMTSDSQHKRILSKLTKDIAEEFSIKIDNYHRAD